MGNSTPPRLTRLALAVALLVGAAACGGDTNLIIPTGPSVVVDDGDGGGSTPISRADVIEFRVTGNATSARVRHSTNVDGLTQVVTTLPYTVTITSTAASIFLALDATPNGYLFGGGSVFPFLAVQIFVNGRLFREATSTDLFLTTLSVSGTWRH